MQDSNNLLVAEHAHRLSIATYRHTSAFPASEKFGLTSQSRRAAVSIASCIAEGCGRRSNNELLHYLYLASGSASEFACQLRISSELGFGDISSAAQLADEQRRIARMLNRLISFHRQQPPKRQKRPPRRTRPSSTDCPMSLTTSPHHRLTAYLIHQFTD